MDLLIPENGLLIWTVLSLISAALFILLLYFVIRLLNKKLK